MPPKSPKTQVPETDAPELPQDVKQEEFKTFRGTVVGADLEQPTDQQQATETAQPQVELGKKGKKKREKSKASRPKKEKNAAPNGHTADGQEAGATKPAKKKRQKKDKPEVEDVPQDNDTQTIAQQSTKSTLGQDHGQEQEEESKVSGASGAIFQVNRSAEEAPKKKKKTARNRTQVQPTVGEADYVADSDSEDFKEALKLAAEVEMDDGNQKEESEGFLASKDLEAALAGANSDTEEGDEPMAQEEEESKQPEKVAKKKPAAKKEKVASKPAAKADDKQGNKHAKVQPTKIMMNEKEAKSAVSEYMQAQNRPYSLQNVMDNLHGRIVRKICQQVLDDLTDEQHLVCKEFGKAKIYLANQDKFPETSTDQLAGLDAQISEKKSKLDTAKDKLKELQQQLKSVTSQMTNKTYIDNIEQLKMHNKEAEERLQAYRDGGQIMVTEDEVDQVKKDYENYQKHWRVRRRATLEIVDMICESVDQNRREFFEQVGLETDEDYGVNLVDFHAEAKI